MMKYDREAFMTLLLVNINFEYGKYPFKSLTHAKFFSHLIMITSDLQSVN